VIGRRRRNAKQQEWERRISALERYWSALPVPARHPLLQHLTDSELEELDQYSDVGRKESAGQRMMISFFH
jgi:hypothetical protein